MNVIRKAVVVGCASVFALGIVLLVSGCENSTKETGTQVKVDQAEQDQHNKAMMDYMQGKTAKKGAKK